MSLEMVMRMFWMAAIRSSVRTTEFSILFIRISEAFLCSSAKKTLVDSSEALASTELAHQAAAEA